MSQAVIKLKFDKKLDQEKAWDFFRDQRFGGANFWQERALAHHPELSKMSLIKNKRSYLNQYILEFYENNADEIKEISQKTTTYVRQSEAGFFQIVDKIFYKYPWPRKEFVGVFSIFDFCPRWLDWGGFQIFLYDNRHRQLFTIYHEMLHFIFYSFVQKTFPKKFAHLNTDEGKFWDLAEIFNAVIQNSEDFIKLHGKIEGIGYPDHQRLLIEGNNLWQAKKDLKLWVIEMIKIIEREYK